MINKQNLEETVKMLQNQNFYEIKRTFGKGGLNFFRKIKNKNPSTLLDLQTNKFNIHLDNENNLIILNDKITDNPQIIFVELTHEGVDSLNLYNSLIKTMNPLYILIEQEPFQINRILNDDKNINTDISKRGEFEEVDLYKSYMKKVNQDLILKKDNYYKIVTNELKPIESFIYQSLCLKNKNVVLFDVPYHKFVKSFSHYLKKNENNNNNYEFLRQFTSILTSLELISWVSAQEKIGCKTCASFFNKKEIQWQPLKPEFLIDKQLLPNIEFIKNYKVKKIEEFVNKSQNRTAMVFSSDVRNLCNDYLNSNNKNIEFEFDENFENSHFSDQNNINYISLALHLKENSLDYFNKPPIKMQDVSKENFKNFQNSFNRDFDYIYDFKINEIDKLITKKQENEKMCYPYNYFKTMNFI